MSRPRPGSGPSRSPCPRLHRRRAVRPRAAHRRACYARPDNRRRRPATRSEPIPPHEIPRCNADPLPDPATGQRPMRPPARGRAPCHRAHAPFAARDTRARRTATGRSIGSPHAQDGGRTGARHPCRQAQTRRRQPLDPRRRGRPRGPLSARPAEHEPCRTPRSAVSAPRVSGLGLSVMPPADRDRSPRSRIATQRPGNRQAPEPRPAILAATSREAGTDTRAVRASALSSRRARRSRTSPAARAAKRRSRIGAPRAVTRDPVEICRGGRSGRRPVSSTSSRASAWRVDSPASPVHRAAPDGGEAVTGRTSHEQRPVVGCASTPGDDCGAADSPRAPCSATGFRWGVAAHRGGELDGGARRSRFQWPKAQMRPSLEWSFSTRGGAQYAGTSQARA